LILIIHVFVNSFHHHRILYYISMIINAIIIIIMAFQSFLYLNIGKRLYHLLKNFYEDEKLEQDSMTNLMSNTTPATDINHFIEHNKLPRNTLNISPSL